LPHTAVDGTDYVKVNRTWLNGDRLIPHTPHLTATLPFVVILFERDYRLPPTPCTHNHSSRTAARTHTTPPAPHTLYFTYPAVVRACLPTPTLPATTPPTPPPAALHIRWPTFVTRGHVALRTLPCATRRRPHTLPTLTYPACGYRGRTPFLPRHRHARRRCCRYLTQAPLPLLARISSV